MKARTEKCLGLFLILLLFLTPSFSNAQDTTSCNPAALRTAFASILTTFSQAQEALATDDIDAMLSALGVMQAQISDIQVQCGISDGTDRDENRETALTFSGTGNEAAGPFDLPSGTYQVHGEFSAFALATLEQLSGDCGIVFGDSMPILTVSDMSGGTADAVLRSKGCRAMLTMLTMGGNWEISFERVG